MNTIIAQVQRLRLRQTLTAVLIGMIFFVSAALGAVSSALPASAEPVTPEAKSYQVSPTERQVGTDSEDGEGLGESLKNTAETVREKLNLDQPLPESTKDFFKQIKGEPVTIEEPRPSGKGGAAQN